MPTRLADSASKAAFTAAVNAAARGSKRGAGAAAAVAAWGGGAGILRIKNGATLIASATVPIGGYGASGQDIVITAISSTPGSWSTPADATPPTSGSLWSLEFEVGGTVRLRCDSVGALASSAELKVSPMKAGIQFGLGVGSYSMLRLRLARSIDPYLPARIVIKGAGSVQASVPHQLGTMCAKGEIPNHPRLVVDGTPTDEQVHVDSRWEDGSCKIIAPRFARNVLTTDQVLTFTDRADPAYSTPTLASLLSAFPDFDLTHSMRFGYTSSLEERFSGVNLNSTVTECSLGTGSTTLAGNVNTIISDAVASWRVDGTRQFCVVPKATATVGQMSVLRTKTSDGTFREYTYTVLAGHLTTYTKSLRAMMVAGAAQVIRSGPNVVRVRIADFVAKAHDIGPSPAQARPIADVEFWLGLSKVWYRTRIENSDTEKVGSFCASWKLTYGVSSPATIEDCGVLHWQADSKAGNAEGWSGTAPFEPDYDHQPARLGLIGAIVPLNEAITPSTAHLTAVQSGWNAAPKGPGDAGLIRREMTNTGGRPDIGPKTQWAADWLLAGKAWQRVMCKKLADLSLNFGMSPREGSSTRRFGNRGVTTGPLAIGRPVGFQVRRSAGVNSSYSGNGYGSNQQMTRTADKSTIVGPNYQMGWLQDDQHCPDMHYVPYLLTGDLSRLDDLQGQYAYQVKTIGAAGCDLSGADADSTVSWARNKNPNYFGPSGAARSSAWTMREQLMAWIASDPSDPIKGDAAESLLDHIVWLEGVTRSNPARAGVRPDYDWRLARIAADAAASDLTGKWLAADNPLHIPEFKLYGLGGYGSGTNFSNSIAMWQNYMLDIVINWAAAAGFSEVQVLRAWRWVFYREMVLGGYITQWALGEYVTPVALNSPNHERPIASIAEMLVAYGKSVGYNGPASVASFYGWTIEQGYEVMLIAALAGFSDMDGFDAVDDAFGAVVRQMMVDGTSPAEKYETGGTYAFKVIK
jgi:hypothetical protein